MSNALMMAIIATLRPVPAVAAAGIVPVGSKATSQNAVVDSSHTAVTLACDLPAGCVAGDTVVLSCNGFATRSFAWVKPTNAVAIIASTTHDTMVNAAYAYVLTQADMDAATVSVPCTMLASSSITTTVFVNVYRNIDGMPIDVIGSFATGTFTANPSATITAPSITTTQDGDAVQYIAFTAVTAGYLSVTAPSGWVGNDLLPPTSQGMSCVTGYMLQSSHGATGDVTLTISSKVGQLSSPYATVLISLSAYNPTFRLTGTLPNATVGTAWTGVLNFTGDFTGTITIDASAGTIPAWMGTPTIDYTAKTITWSGTPTTAKTESFTPRATSTGGQVAVGPAQSVVVSAASASPVIASTIVDQSDTARTVVSCDATGTAVGTALYFVVFDYAAGSVDPTTPPGFTPIFRGYIPGTFLYGCSVFGRTADGTEGVVSSTLASSQVAGSMLLKITGAAITGTVGGIATANSSYPNFPMVTPSAANSLLLGLVYLQGSGSSTAPSALSPPWSLVAWTNQALSAKAIIVQQTLTAAVSSGGGTLATKSPGVARTFVTLAIPPK